MKTRHELPEDCIEQVRRTRCRQNPREWPFEFKGRGSNTGSPSARGVLSSVRFLTLQINPLSRMMLKRMQRQAEPQQECITDRKAASLLALRMTDFKLESQEMNRASPSFPRNCLHDGAKE